MTADPLFERNGFHHFLQVFDEAEIGRLRSVGAGDARPGVRLEAAALGQVADLIGRDGKLGKLAATLLGRPAFAVRAIMFDKHVDANWSLDWHQDRTIAVAARFDVPGFGNWTIKQGLSHVEPPQPVLEAMVTVRAHLDDVPANNAPLRVLAGSHRLGRLQQDRIEELIPRSKIVECLAASGNVWAYRTLIVHGSSAAEPNLGHRRVLQLDYASRPLPSPLRWVMAA